MRIARNQTEGVKRILKGRSTRPVFKGLRTGNFIETSFDKMQIYRLKTNSNSLSNAFKGSRVQSSQVFIVLL